MARDGLGTLVGVASCIAAFVALGFLPSLLAGADVADPTQQTCDERAQRLPATVPQRVVLDVTDEGGHRVPADLEPRVRREVESAVVRFPFHDAISVATRGPAPPPSDNATRVVDVQLWLQRRLLPGGAPAEGALCGDTILVQERDDEAANAWTDAHELGHLFGLPHADGTLMNAHAFRGGRYESFSPCQQALLARWVPGAPYVPPWKQPACRVEEPRWVVFWESLRNGPRGLAA